MMITQLLLQYQYIKNYFITIQKILTLGSSDLKFTSRGIQGGLYDYFVANVEQNGKKCNCASTGNPEIQLSLDTSRLYSYIRIPDNSPVSGYICREI